MYLINLNIKERLKKRFFTNKTSIYFSKFCDFLMNVIIKIFEIPQLKQALDVDRKVEKIG